MQVEGRVCNVIYFFGREKRFDENKMMKIYSTYTWPLSYKPLGTILYITRFHICWLCATANFIWDLFFVTMINQTVTLYWKTLVRKSQIILDISQNNQMFAVIVTVTYENCHTWHCHNSYTHKNWNSILPYS